MSKRTGDCLAAPITEKHTTYFENPRMRAAVCGMQGWRKTMEDGHLLQIKLEDGNSLFGVFDGHVSGLLAKFCGEQLPEFLTGSASYQSGNYGEAFKEAYLAIDKHLSTSELKDEGGCTAVCVLFAKGKMYCANAGDSRAVLCRGGKAIRMSQDHKPSVESEVERIEAAGGYVAHDRVNGLLGVSRAIGDFDLKQNDKLPPQAQAISAFPDITVFDSVKEDDYVLIACDGIWDVLTDEEACTFTSRELEKIQNDVAMVVENLLDQCVSKTGVGPGTDNMTALVVQPKQEFKDSLAQ